ncbi:hypothetical protein [Paenarthrobacter sp. PH39-S1]|uniref:hypothetical protein n=1 Tax=Paenarthrobacter sp. PH39-S1 TaxID=3046204 RepID=UPI0024BB2212|nr:hypothetical protein [Paenarthrobacter sp. PH39-S1]MDJ0357245.1 hypothetical protein [Paenarthrobacter sp. PH39-S1]
MKRRNNVVGGGMDGGVNTTEKSAGAPTGVGTESAKAQERLFDAWLNMQRSVDSLGPALAALKPATSAQLARSAQAAENAWRRMEDEFGLLTSTQVAVLLGSRSAGRSFASEQHRAGHLLRIRRRNAYLYPGFQFDRRAGKVLDVIAVLVRLARASHWSEEDLALWFVSPTSYFEDEGRPVDHLDHPHALTEAAEAKFTVEW